MSNNPNESVTKAYKEHVQQLAPKSNLLANCLKAFLVGGLICALGQGVGDLGKELCKLPKESLSTFTSIVMVFLGATLTGIGVYDRIGKFAGAGSIVPITGFANSVVSPAMEFKSEGYVLGTGAKLFLLAGPVLVNGYSAALVCGIIAWIVKIAGSGG